MGQPYPHLPNNAFSQGVPGMLPAGANQLNPSQAAAMAQALQGVDPRMLAMAQQQMADPNGGDILSAILPGPKEAALGAGAGLVTALGMSAFMGEKLDGPIPEAAKWMDKLKGVKSVSQWLGRQQAGLVKRFPFLGESFLSSTLPELDSTRHPALAATQTVNTMEEKHIGRVLAKFPNRFNEQQQQAYQSLLAEHGATIREKYRELTENHFRESLKKVESEYQGEVLKTLTQQLKNERKAALQWAEKGQTPLFFSKKADWLATHPQQGRFQNVMNLTQAKLDILEGLGDKATQQHRQIYQHLRGLKERVSGLNSFYKPSYEAQAKLSAKLAHDGVGPIGRGIALGGQYLQRIFNGETLSMGGKSIFNAGLMGPLFAGMFIFGLSFKKAGQAKEGEKTKTFFHDFFGTGIANFIGWELGKKWLNSTGVFHKLLGRFATKRPFDSTRIGRWVPFFGENFGKMVQKACGEKNAVAKTLGLITGKGLGGFFSRMTLGGLATELTAMFVFGSGVQWVGEKLAHVIFGKPSPESLEGNAAPKAPSFPMNYAPGPAASPGTSPMGLGAGPGMPLWQTGRTGRMGASPPAFQAALGNVGTPQARAAQSYSISPEQITQNSYAEAANGLQSQILKSNQVQESKNHGRMNYFDPNSF